MTISQSKTSSFTSKSLTLILMLATLCLPSASQAQQIAQRIISTFLADGVYFLTDSTGRDALGSVQFYNQAVLHGRPKQFANLVQISGGLEIVSVTDHFFPFSGGNRLNLFGASVRITTKRALGRLRPYFSAGLFLGDLRSDRIGISKTDFTPSVSLGAEWPFARYFTFTAGYRFVERIGGVGTDGFFLTLRFF